MLMIAIESPTEAAAVQTTARRRLIVFIGKIVGVCAVGNKAHYRPIGGIGRGRFEGSAMLKRPKNMAFSGSCRGFHQFKGDFLASLSVTVITKNEAHNIGACLHSVMFADQIVVVDSGSTDETVQIAKSLGAEVVVSADWPGFGVQKNRALAQANSEWVLSIDADERLTPELLAEIQVTLTAPQFDAYSFPRLSSYCGQYIRHSGWYPDRVTRLFRRQSARFSNDLVHEKLITSTAVGQLNSPLLHESFRDAESVIDKVNRYSTAGAQSLFTRGKKSSLSKALFRGLWAFFRTYFLRLGFLDGRLGLVLAISNAEGTYYRYLKLWLLHQGSGPVPPTR